MNPISFKIMFFELRLGLYIAWKARKTPLSFFVVLKEETLIFFSIYQDITLFRRQQVLSGSIQSLCRLYVTFESSSNMVEQLMFRG